MRLSILLLLLLSLNNFLNGQKIISDQVRPVSGKRQIVTDLLPVFQMKVIQVAAVANVGQGDTTCSLGFYFSQGYPASVELNKDTTKLICIIVLSDGKRIIGNYSSTSEAFGYQIYAYDFKYEDFKNLSKISTNAFSIGFPRSGTGEFTLEKKYQDAFQKVTASVIKRLENK